MTVVPKLPGQVRKVAFTGDFLRIAPAKGAFSSSQSRNVSWLQDVLTGAECWRHIEPGLFRAFPAEGAALADSGALKAPALESYLEDPEAAWALRHGAVAVTDFPAVLDSLASADLVVGFELPPALKRSLHHSGKPYLSFHIHALRMLPDLCFGATTNVPQIAQWLDAETLPEAAIARAVHHHRALCRFHNLPALQVPAGLPVLIGQTARDSVLIEKGRFSSWRDHADPLDELLRGHSSLVLLEHPYRADSMEIGEYLRTVHGKHVFSMAANGYGILFTNQQIPFVATLSSSLGVEAQAAGTPAHFLLQDPRLRMQVDDFDRGPPGPLGHGILGNAFWERILEGHESSTTRKSLANERNPFVLGDNYLRSCLDGWSYRLLQNGLAGATNRTYHFPAAAATEQGSGFGQSPIWQTHAIDFVELDPPLGLDETRFVDFSWRSAAGYLAHGFEPVGQVGAWSLGQSAQLRIGLTAAAVESAAVISLKLRLQIPKAALVACPVIAAAAAEQPLGYALFQPEGPHTCTLSVRCRPVGRVLTVSLTASASGVASSSPAADSSLSKFLLVDMHLACTALPQGRKSPAPLRTTVVGLGEEPLALPLSATHGPHS